MSQRQTKYLGHLSYEGYNCTDKLLLSHTEHLWTMQVQHTKHNLHAFFPKDCERQLSGVSGVKVKKEKTTLAT